jgi:hypothetical protein
MTHFRITDLNLKNKAINEKKKKKRKEKKENSKIEGEEF